MTTVLITGASGFVGKHLVQLFEGKAYAVRRCVRTPADSEMPGKGSETVVYDLAAEDSDYKTILKDVDVVIHLAGIAHNKTISDDEHIRINQEGTARLASAAVANGVKRFVYISTIKVHGENSVIDNVASAITEETRTSPCDGYSLSRLMAEQSLMQACRESDMEYVILRPPLVYGPGVKANFLRLLKAVAVGIPLPLGSLKNRRSMIYVENLCDLIIRCVDNLNARNQVFVLKDYDISTPDLIRKIASAFGKSARLFPFPVEALRFFMRTTGKAEMFDRLAGSLVVDDSRLREVMQWTPVVPLEDGIARTVEWYKAVN